MASHIRNVAIIAHVDHGKTTLVDALLRQSGTFRENEEIPERAMDSMDLERERGITIAAKNCTIEWEGLTINIVDTPGHSDFGGEVERVLSMVDGALLLVDAAEGPLPQTRFVLSKALAAGLGLVVVINKIDRKDARTFEVRNEIFSLMIDCGADDRHLESPVLYAVAREGVATAEIGGTPRDIRPVFEAIRDHIPPPAVDLEAPLSLIVANLGYSDYVGRLAVGRVKSGRLRVADPVLVAADGRTYRGAPTVIYGFRGVKAVEKDEADAGEIVSVAGFEEIAIGDTITAVETPVVQPRIKVEEPTVEMLFGANTSPFAGREGKYVTGRVLGERLVREGLRNVSLRIREVEDGRFVVAGRGELQLAILIEQMRREGFEMEVSRPHVIEREVNGERHEPFEALVVDVAEEFIGAVTEILSMRRGVMHRLDGVGTGRVRMEFRIPARGLIGVRSRFLTLTRGTGLLHAVFDGYAPLAARIASRTTGSMIADRVCEATPYALENLEDRGILFVGPNTPCYAGMIVGEHAKEEDIEVYVGRPKKLTNVRASGSDDAVVLTPHLAHTLESAMEWIGDDDLIEATPSSIRLRKRELDPSKRKAARKAASAEG